MKCQAYNTECKRGCSSSCWAKQNRSYRPSNGTEGMSFMEDFCHQCIHDNPDPISSKKCEILTATLFYAPYEEEYPKEWVEDADGRNPRCTNFVKWDWNNGDPDDPDNPLAPPPPPDPNQLNIFPLYPTETHFHEQKQEIAVTM